MQRTVRTAVTRRPDLTRRRMGMAALAALAGLGCALTSLLVWLTLPDGAGGTTSVDGWGGVTGGAEMSGHNLNDFLTGYGSYRPGLIPLLAGVPALVCAVVLASVRIGRRPHRVTAAVLALCAVIAVGFGVLRVISPDAAGVLLAGEGSAGLGPWLSIVAGLVLGAVGGSVLAGVLDPPEPLRPRGIQPGAVACNDDPGGGDT